MRACSLACAPSILSILPGLGTLCLGNDATHGGLGLTTVAILSQGMPGLSSQVILGYAKTTKLALQPLRETQGLQHCSLESPELHRGMWNTRRVNPGQGRLSCSEAV